MWLRDELILALDLYLRRGTLGKQDPSVKELSELLRSLPLHPQHLVTNSASFRSDHSVRMKLANFASIDPDHTGRALENIGGGDRLIWEEFHDDRARLSQLAANIRKAARDLQAIPAADDSTSASEGGVLYRLHRVTERNASLVRRKKDQACRVQGRLACEGCGFDFAEAYGDHGDGFIECHHVLAFEHNPGPRRTRLRDLALVCANCHRMLHHGARRPTLDELRVMLASST